MPPKNRSKKPKNKRNRTYKRIKGGLEPISTTLGITTAAAKIHSLHLLNLHHLIALHGVGGNMISMHLFLHKALIKNIAHISSTTSAIHPSLHLTGASSHLLTHNISENTFITWLKNCGITIKTFFNALITNPLIITLKITKGFILKPSIIFNPFLQILLGILFTKLLPKILLITTGQIPVNDALILFGWYSDVKIQLTKNIIDEIKSDIKNYSIMVNGIINPKENILGSDDFTMVKKMNNVLKILRELDEDNTLSIDYNNLYEEKENPEETVQNMMLKFLDAVDDFLMNDLGEIYAVPVSKVHEIYCELDNFIILKELKEKNRQNETNAQIFLNNIKNDIITQLINKIIMFGICGEMSSVFGVHMLQWLNNNIVNVLILSGTMKYHISELMNNIYENIETEEIKLIENKRTQESVNALIGALAINATSKLQKDEQIQKDIPKNNPSEEPITNVIEIREKIKSKLLELPSSENYAQNYAQ